MIELKNISKTYGKKETAFTALSEVSFSIPDGASVAIVGKSGSGKSTLVTHLAVAAELAGDGPVVITDTDPQGTTADWFNACEAETPG